MRVSQLAEVSGVPATTLRFYEQEGLLPAGRTAAGYRVYGRTAVDRLAFIGTAKHLGLPLREIRELLGVWKGGACRDVRAQFRPRLTARLEEAAVQRRLLADFERELMSALEHLDALPDRSSRCDRGCSFLHDPTGVQPDDSAESPPTPTEAIACSLTGADHAVRIGRWRQALGNAPRTAVDGGYALHLPRRAVEAVMLLVSEEHECCPFLTFRLQLDGTGLRVEVTAPPEATSLIDQLFSP
ncbi:MerR family transcriptional regulator [uncultured Modestobacter sp.]|uniref:MerR family transcriptional regulator n=1 Tax=uncultured Modestobacter sp. TaxID=380048 RepID=UPI0026043B0B|nr:MerR family transcriptional regulator [uncultured Modestobacter sp.]